MSIFTDYISPFYGFARSYLHLSPKVIREFIDHGGVATIEGRTVMLRYADDSGQPHVRAGRVKLGHSRRATEWTNQFNKRVERMAVR